MTTLPEPAASQREVDLLREDVRSLVLRIDTLDTHGTRGVQTLQVQLIDAIKDISDIKSDFAAFKAEHIRLHKEENDSRAKARRWVITTCIAGVGGFGSTTYLLIDILSKVH